MRCHRSHRTVRAVAAISALAVVTVTGCASDDAADVDDTFDLEVADDAPVQPPDADPGDDPGDADPGDADPEPDDPEPADPEPADPGDADPEPDDPGDEVPPADIIEDGRHPAYLTDIDLDEGTITVDVIQFLTGDDAIAAYREDEPDDPDGVPPNDYHIRNVNPMLRTLPVAPAVMVTIVTPEAGTGADPVASSFAALPGHLATHSPPPGRLGWNPFWLTVEGDVVLAIDEQFLP